MAKLLKKIFIIVSIFIFAGCSPKILVPDISNLPSAGNLSKYPFGQLSTNVDHFSALFKVKSEVVSEIRYAVHFLAPNNLRIELFPLNSFYQLGLFVVSDGKFNFRSVNDSNVYAGDFSRAVMLDKLGLSFEVNQLVSALTRTIPVDSLEGELFTSKNNTLIYYANNAQFIGEYEPITNRPIAFYYLNDSVPIAKVTYLNNISECAMNIQVPEVTDEFNVDCLSFKTSIPPSKNLFSISLP
jgi:hypothetical protein